MKDDINLKLDKPIRIVDIFGNDYIDKYTLNSVGDTLVSFCDDNFNDAMRKFINHKYNKKYSRLFINIISYILENETGFDSNGNVVKKYTSKQREFLLLMLCNGWDFRWCKPSSKTNSMKKIKKSFLALSSQIKPKDSIYRTEFQEAFDIAVKCNKPIGALFDTDFWYTTEEKEFLILLYSNGFSVEKNSFGDYVVKNNVDTVCKVKKEILTNTYVDLLKSLVELRIDITHYLYYKATEDKIRLHQNICIMKEIDFKYIKDLNDLLVSKLLDLDFSEDNYLDNLIIHINKEASLVENSYSVLNTLENKLLSN